MDRFKAANRASIFGIVGNVFLFIIKIVVGLISSSQAMIADAFNNLALYASTGVGTTLLESFTLNPF